MVKEARTKLQPDDIARIKERHEEFDPDAVENPNALHLSQLNKDRDALLGEVERLQSNFDVVEVEIQNFLNHNARIMQQDHSIAIREIAAKVRGLK